MPVVNANDTELHYQVIGEGSPVLMIHGLLLGNMATWYFGAMSRIVKTHRVILYDLRGHGFSGKPPSGYNLETMSRDLDALVDQLRLDTFALVGHSYGALIALRYALQNPARVTRLSLIEGPLPAGRSLQMDDFRQQDPEAMLRALPDELQKQLLDGSRQGRRLMERLRFLLDDTDLLQHLKTEEDVRNEDLARLKIPTQMIYGEKSQIRDVAERLAQHIPASSLFYLPGGHYLPSEHPQALGELIGDFFS
jgi:esterase